MSEPLVHRPQSPLLVFIMSDNSFSSVRIVEVGPRDGLQNEKKILSTADKFSLIEKLVSCGIRHMEATSFVRAPRVPQLADAEDLFAFINRSPQCKGVHFSVLVPNLKGLAAAILAHAKEIAVFTATSDAFNLKNINATVEESLRRISLACDGARKEGIKIRGYISTAFGCPYGGDASVSSIVKISQELFKLGAYEVVIADTIGTATPEKVGEVVAVLKDNFSLRNIAMHFHDTGKMAVANTLKAFEEGIMVFDASVGGLGGCPYAPGASGNVATEDLVRLFDSLGVETGISRTALEETASWIRGVLGNQPLSHLDPE